MLTKLRNKIEDGISEIGYQTRRIWNLFFKSTVLLSRGNQHNRKWK